MNTEDYRFIRSNQHNCEFFAAEIVHAVNSLLKHSTVKEIFQYRLSQQSGDEIIVITTKDLSTTQLREIQQTFLSAANDTE